MIILVRQQKASGNDLSGKNIIRFYRIEKVLI